MPSAPSRAIRLFRFSGIDVFLHWSWFLIAAIEIQNRSSRYSSITWNIIEYLSLFLIVMLHEFGHALACRQVGGQANRIVLWPLGGVAYVDPPPRPGATLWSIAAGPLVNVALLPIFYFLCMFGRTHGWQHTLPDLYQLMRAIFYIDLGLLIFNILPIYPLDGGQILRSLLWFVVGRGRSLMVATIIGFTGVAAFIALAFYTKSVWYMAISVFMLMNCWSGLKQAQALLKVAKLPRRHGFACPACKISPPVGQYWRCSKCQQPFDTFAAQGVCPSCAARYETTKCIDCGASNPISQWTAYTLTPTGV